LVLVVPDALTAGTTKLVLVNNIPERILEFQARFPKERDFCEELYQYSTIRLLALKYAYYVLNEEIVKDINYDLSEKDWFVMGRALGHLREDETSPCVDWNPDHPLSPLGIQLANKLLGLPTVSEPKVKATTPAPLPEEVNTEPLIIITTQVSYISYLSI
jgi:hypothetical protein